jgi:UDP:flavonoid glycosyltransferase YjiC (YdhE family)
MGGVYVFGSPVSVGHVRPLLPLARRLVERGHPVVWAISGDANEPASVWRAPIEQLGAQFVDVDATTPFPRGATPEISDGGASIRGLYRRIAARANDVAPGAADAIRAAVGDRPIAGGVYDYFGLWAYAAMKRLGIAKLEVVISAFPSVMNSMPPVYTDDPVYQRELAALHLEHELRTGLIPADPALRVISFTSPTLCVDAPPWVRVLGIQREALPRIADLSTAPADHQALARRLQEARAGGSRIVLLSMGTVVTRLFGRLGPGPAGFLKRLYSTLARGALDAGAIVVASTCDSSAAELGIDEATLGPGVIAMPFVPQPLLFAHGLVDVMLMHGGANTFHEAIASGIPLLISPGFGDQENVAKAVGALGIGACVEAVLHPNLEGAVPIDRVASELLPAMLAPGNRWQAKGLALAEQLRHEDGVSAAEALLLGSL